MTTNRSHEILRQLAQAEIDLSITVGTLKDKSIIKHEIYTDTYSFYINNKSPVYSLNFYEEIEIKKFLEDKVLYYMPDAKDANENTLKQYLSTLKLPFLDIFEIDSFDIASHFAIQNFGIALLPDKLASTYSAQLKRAFHPKLSQFNKFGLHKFYLSYRNNLDISEQIIKKIKTATLQAAQEMNMIV